MSKYTYLFYCFWSWYPRQSRIMFDLSSKDVMFSLVGMNFKRIVFHFFGPSVGRLSGQLLSSFLWLYHSAINRLTTDETIIYNQPLKANLHVFHTVAILLYAVKCYTKLISYVKVLLTSIYWVFEVVSCWVREVREQSSSSAWCYCYIRNITKKKFRQIFYSFCLRVF